MTKVKRDLLDRSCQIPITREQSQILKRIGLRISKDLYDTNKPVEWLAFETGLARSTLREIIAGRSNLRVLTLQAIAQALTYESLTEFLENI